jgi:hypothetical protein
MGCAEGISFGEVCARKQWRTLRQQVHLSCAAQALRGVAGLSSQNETHSLVLKKERTGVWLTTGHLPPSSRPDHRLPDRPAHTAWQWLAVRSELKSRNHADYLSAKRTPSPANVNFTPCCADDKLMTTPRELRMVRAPGPLPMAAFASAAT